MKLETPLATLTDDSLLSDLSSLVQKSNALTARLLAYLAEVDRRKLYLGQACSSMHVYCVERLGLSDGAAYKRIHAARAARRFPILFEMIERGELHLKGVTLLAPHLTEQNDREVLERARRRSTRSIEKLVAEIAPRPDRPSRVTPLPRSPNRPKSGLFSAAAASGTEPAPGSAAEPEVGARDAESSNSPPAPQSPPPLAPKKRPAIVEPRAPGRYEIRVTVGEQTRAELKQLQDLLAHQIPNGDPAEIVSRALSLLLERTLARKVGVTDRPREAKPQKEGVRSIPRSIRRSVFVRDEGRCTFRDAKGRRCTAERKLEFHHLDNWALVRKHAPDRIVLRCQAHNQYQAEIDYGEAFMRAARERGGSKAREESGGVYAGAARCVPRGEWSARAAGGSGSRGGKLGGGLSPARLSSLDHFALVPDCGCGVAVTDHFTTRSYRREPVPRTRRARPRQRLVDRLVRHRRRNQARWPAIAAGSAWSLARSCRPFTSSTSTTVAGTAALAVTSTKASSARDAKPRRGRASRLRHHASRCALMPRLAAYARSLFARSALSRTSPA